MANYALREKAISLRKQGHTYSEIKLRLSVPKSTLSCWLCKHPLTSDQIEKIKKGRYRRIEKYRETMQKKKLEKVSGVYVEEENAIGSLSDREFYMAGLGLFWGEGSKLKDSTLELTNTDPTMLRFFIQWCVKGLDVHISSLRISLHLYNDMNIQTETQFWSKELGVPASQFHKPYIKKGDSARINYRGGFGHGTCRITIYNTRLIRKVLMGIKVISNEFARP